MGTNSLPNIGQGNATALSADGSTAIIGVYNDDFGMGAAWLWQRNGVTWTAKKKLVGLGAVGFSDFERRVYQGAAVSLSASGTTAIVGGFGDNANTGAAWVFSAPTSP